MNAYTYDYAMACAIYERTRRRLNGSDPWARKRVVLEATPDGKGFTVNHDFNSRREIRATPGNLYPHPGVLEERYRAHAPGKLVL